MPVPSAFIYPALGILVGPTVLGLFHFNPLKKSALVTLLGHYLLGLPIGAAVLLGVYIAPTDPVPVTDVQIHHPGDRVRLRFTLTCEAGMNDGSAFPFVMLGLHELGESGQGWLLVDVPWATAAGIAIGVAAGSGLARLVVRLRRNHPNTGLLDDFLGLGLIGAVYGVSLLYVTPGAP